MRVGDLKRKSKERVEVSYLRRFKVQSWGADNLYPQVLSDIISSSATGCECVERYADFIEGNGFTNAFISGIEVNRKGDTLDDIHALICKDVAEYDGFALHVNYNAFAEIAEISHVPFENCRLVEEDATGYVSKIAVHADWSGKKSRNGEKIKVDEKNIDYIDVFNPIKEVVYLQIEASGGLESYKGQILWVSGMGRNVYPRPKSDRVITEMSTDEGLSNVKYRNVRCNFLPAGMLVTKKASSSDGEYDEGFSETLSDLQGDTEASKIFEVIVESDEEIPKFVPFASSNYDKEFSVTDGSTVERIYSAFNQESWYCIRIGKIGFSGDILRDAFDYYNSIVSKQRRMIERAMKRIFENWYEDVGNDFSVEPIKFISNADNSTRV